MLRALSIEDIASASLFDPSLAPEVSSVTPIPAITFSLDHDTAGDSAETPARRPLPAADDSGVNSDLGRLKEDLQTQLTPTLSSGLGNDLVSLLKDLTTGDTSAARADTSKVQVDLETQDASSVAGTPTGEPLGALIGKISDSLAPGSVQGAPQDSARHDLATFLVENGRGTGSLINTSA